MNTRLWEINIHGCYSLVKINFAPIDKYDIILPRIRMTSQVNCGDIKFQVRKNILDNDHKMSDWLLFLIDFYVQGIK